MIKIKIFYTLIVFLSSGLTLGSCRINRDEQGILVTVDKIKSRDEKVGYLEGVSKKNKSHPVLYTLASLYLEKGELTKSETLLKRDLKVNKNPYDAYESYSLLFGLYSDQNREVSEREMDRYYDLFKKMKVRGAKKIAKLDKYLDKTRNSKDTKLLLEERERIKYLLKDPFQFERMVGDYFYRKGNLDGAFRFYESFYQDLDKPLNTFGAESMRNYVDLLLRKNQTEEALLFMGYVINLKPYMMEDLFKFSGLYYSLNDRMNSILIMMFINTLSDGYSSLYYQKSRELILQLTLEIRDYPGSKKIINLTEIYLAGRNISSIPIILDGLRREGVSNFFFNYLEGVNSLMEKNYSGALKEFMEFNRIYPYLADSYYYALVCMYNLDKNSYGKDIIDYAERVIELKPQSTLSKMTKAYIGKMLGLGEGESEKLLVSSELQSIMDNFVNQGAPVNIFDRFMDSLTIEKNPYQIAGVQLIAGIDKRREEFLSYLKKEYKVLNSNGKKNVEEILSRMGELLD